MKSWGYKIVEKKDGHPVRAGERSMRFELRAGDCGHSSNWNDCNKDRERHEVYDSSPAGSGENWYHWSIFIPEDYKIVHPVKNALGQFKLGDSSSISGHPVFMFQNKDGGYWADNQVPGGTIQMTRLLSDEEMRGEWSDILIHADWTTKNDGFFYVYVNGETLPRYQWDGPTKVRGKYQRVWLKFGLYRTYVSQWRDGPIPTQVVYFDSMAEGDECSEVTTLFDCSKIAEERSSLRVVRMFEACDDGLCKTEPDWKNRGLRERLACWYDKAKASELSGLPSQSEISELIDSIIRSENGHAVSKLRLRRYANGGNYVKEHGSAIAGAINFIGPDEVFCANPLG